MRRIIRNNPVLYPLYVRYVVKNRTAIFPSSRTKLHITGFPRSANTYCYNVVKQVFPALCISTHIHTIASIRLAFKWDVPVVLIVRDPINTVASLCVMKSSAASHDVRTLLLDYLEYHKYVIGKVGGIKILRFEDVVCSKEFLLKEICQSLGVQCTCEELRELATGAESLAESKERGKPMAYSSLPRAEREEAKKKLMELIYASPLCQRAEELHRLLLMHAVRSDLG